MDGAGDFVRALNEVRPEIVIVLMLVLFICCILLPSGIGLALWVRKTIKGGPITGVESNPKEERARIRNGGSKGTNLNIIYDTTLQTLLIVTQLTKRLDAIDSRLSEGDKWMVGQDMETSHLRTALGRLEDRMRQSKHWQPSEKDEALAALKVLQDRIHELEHNV